MQVHLSYKLLLVSLALLLLLTAAPSHLLAADLDQLEQKAFRAAVDRVAPSVVRIETLGGLERVGEVLFGTGPTTGLVLTADGYLVSSAFNFAQRPASILVQLPDGSRKPAKLVATDHNRMIVLLKIEPDKPLPVPEIAPEKETRVGQWAVGVGRAFEANEPNMSVGVISATNRIWGKAIQTDAAVSPNNYGGPLVDVHGRVLGVLVPLSPEATTEMAGYEWYDSGIGFAVPAEFIQKLLPKLKEGKDLRPGMTGISMPARTMQVGEAVISAVRPRSPAQKAGLKSGDRVVEIDGQKIDRAAMVKQEIARRYAGDKLRLVVLRDSKRVEAEVDMVAKLDPYQQPFLGILPLRASSDQAEAKEPGIPVRYVYPDSPAAKAGIQPSDVLVSLDGKPVEDLRKFRARFRETQPEDTIQLEVRCAKDTRKLEVKLATVPEAIPAENIPPAHPTAKPAEGKEPERGSIELKGQMIRNPVAAYVPETYSPDVAYGIVVWLHGSEGLKEAELIAAWKPLCDRHDLILVAPKAAATRWRPADLRSVPVLLAQLTSSYNIDPSRVAVCGRENGGALAYTAGFAYGNLVRAVAVIDASISGTMPERDSPLGLAFYVARAEKSRLAGAIKQTVARLREMKLPVTVKELGPEPRDLNPNELGELARWIDALDRI